MTQSPATPVVAQLRNTFLLLRHGHSVANQQSLIVSSPEIGIEQFGLTDTGTEQVRSCVLANRSQLEPVSKIYASDFLRTRQTAEIVAESLKVQVEMASSLRERRFGDWEGKSSQNYERVWQADANDPSHQSWQVESVKSVADRMLGFVQQIDQSSVNQTYLLVSHGDPLQILLTAARGYDLGMHRSLRPIQTAQIRLLATLESMP